MSAGSALPAEDRLEESTPIVELPLEAGAICDLQTAVPEAYIIKLTWSELWGVTRNPWSLGNGVPTGMQIAGRAYDDLTALRVAAAHATGMPPLFSGDHRPDFREA